MRTSITFALVAALRLASALPVASPVNGLEAQEEKRDGGIYTYYTIPAEAKEKRDGGIYTYYTIPAEAKEKRDGGIYTYYTIPAEAKEKRDGGIYTYYTIPEGAKKEKREVEERSPQDFADDE